MLKSILAGAAFALVASTVSAATAAKDDWITVRNSMVIKAPAEKLWSVVGGFCDLPRLNKQTCTYIKGTGGLGTVRLTDGEAQGVKIGEGKYNFSFFYTVGGSRGGPPVEARYHTNLEVVPSDDNKTSTLIITLVYDQSVLADDAERAARKASHINGFEEHFRTTKELAEKK